MLLASLGEEGEAPRPKLLSCNYINILRVQIHILPSFPAFKDKTKEHFL